MSEDTLPSVRIKVSWLIGTLAAFGIFVLVGAYSARMTRNYTDYDREQVNIRLSNLQQVRTEEGKLIEPVTADGKPTAEWIDQQKGTVRIPIEQAMALEVDTLKPQAPAMCAEINPAPAAGAAPAPMPPASTNAAAATPPAKPASGKPAPAKPAKPAKPVKAAVLSPGLINQPVFNTRRINTQPGVDTQPFRGFITYGGVPIPVNPSVISAARPAAATSN